MEKEIEISAVGIMSGTSLDGVDLAFCRFTRRDNKWNYIIEVSETKAYSADWKKRLATIMLTDAALYARTHADLGRLFGTLAKKFIDSNHLIPDLIASHGHTVFHQPHNGFTAQIGDGSQIAAITQVDTVCDFRSKDVALGGQGAPLVPIGDRLLFNQYDVCINLGGIANISYQKSDKRIAFDVCPVNIVLNELAALTGKSYDEDGKLAASGLPDKQLLDVLNQLDYYKQTFPKSIGREWIDKTFLPLVLNSNMALENKACTVCNHIVRQLVAAIDSALIGRPNAEELKVLVTGGGAFNKYLMNLLQKATKHQIVIPDEKTIAFKEAIIFAFLGVLFKCGEENVLSSVTGAKRNHVSGALYKA